jgi:diaminohydroxyphosphoribosylaminopyrimidine deaminase / 5-amino-6-(5-phosphoribosylamino)uracil reductase
MDTVQRPWSSQEIAFMTMALKIAASQVGRTGANPAVGCVIAKDEEVVGLAVTSDGGRPHGEANALAQAGDRAVGSDVYVTLEPCAHVSVRGPTCAHSLVDAKVARVFACLEDPDPRTAGAGFSWLRAAGIECHVGLMRSEGQAQIASFRPLST